MALAVVLPLRPAPAGAQEPTTTTTLQAPNALPGADPDGSVALYLVLALTAGAVLGTAIFGRRS